MFLYLCFFVLVDLITNGAWLILTTDRLSLLLAKDRSHPQTYLGCMKKGPVFTDPNLKWLV